MQFCRRLAFGSFGPVVNAAFAESDLITTVALGVILPVKLDRSSGGYSKLLVRAAHQRICTAH